jgi:hypothetical protein
MRIIRASEVNTYLYCQHAWFYHLKGWKPSNQAELNAGTQLHIQHGRLVVGTWLIRILAFVLLATAVLLILKTLMP